MNIAALLAGLFSGIIGGMGMGGGTLLIPILNIFFNIGQHTAQAINLISFIPMAVVAVILHMKNKLIDYKIVLPIIIAGVFSCVGGCFIARIISGKLLTRFFGAFLTILAGYGLKDMIKKQKRNK